MPVTALQVRVGISFCITSPSRNPLEFICCKVAVNAPDALLRLSVPFPVVAVIVSLAVKVPVDSVIQSILFVESHLRIIPVFVLVPPVIFSPARNVPVIVPVRNNVFILLPELYFMNIVFGSVDVFATDLITRPVARECLPKNVLLSKFETVISEPLYCASNFIYGGLLKENCAPET